MITIDVCMETVFADLPFCDRVARIANAGFKAVEAWFPELHLKDEFVKLRKACESAVLALCLERGSAIAVLWMTAVLAPPLARWAYP